MTNARFSIIPARALSDRRLNRTDILVLNALGMYGDREGWSFPSTSTIGEMLGGAHRTSVSKAISNLVEYGYVEARARHREDGGQTSNEYRILFDAPAQAAFEFANHHADAPPVVESPPPCSESTTPPVVAGTTPPVAVPLHRNEPTLTPQGNEKGISPRQGAAEKAPRKKYPDEFLIFWNAWPKERRCEQPNAYAEWRKAIAKISPAELQEAARAYLATKESTDGFAPYPAKWLKRERWLEFQPEVKADEAPPQLGRNDVEAAFLNELHKRLRAQHGEAVYRSWFRNSLTRADLADGELCFTVTTRFIAEWITTHYAGDIERHAKDTALRFSSLRITASPPART